jgi:predicted CXXCH cytochrome family protein
MCADKTIQVLLALTIAAALLRPGASPCASPDGGGPPSTDQIRPVVEIINPHFTGKDCAICHEGTPRADDTTALLKFGGDDIAMCNSCHQTEYLKGDLHPVAVAPSPDDTIRVPPELPLYGGRVTCRTCHDVYLQCRKRPSLQFENINFLRGAPYKKTVDLCFRCHALDIYKKTNPHQQVDEAGNLIKESCLYCHQTLPDPDATASIDEVTFKTETSTFCFACHGEEEKLHPARANHILPVPGEMTRSIGATEQQERVSLPLFKGEIFCGTCHNPHDKGVIKREAAAKVADEKLRLRLEASYQLCVACHSDKRDLRTRQTDIVISDKDLSVGGRGGEIPSHVEFLDKNCRACHAITRQNPDRPTVYKMCFAADCHDTSLMAGPFKHRLVQQGNCLLCHNQHGYLFGAHIVNDQQKLCRACHPLITPMEENGTDAGRKEQGGDFHDYYLQLFRKLLPDREISCRYCHGEDHSSAIYGKGIIPCYQCHNYIKELIANKPGKGKNIHDTFTRFVRNKCTHCHDPHSSSFPHLLQEEPDSYK